MSGAEGALHAQVGIVGKTAEGTEKTVGKIVEKIIKITKATDLTAEAVEKATETAEKAVEAVEKVVEVAVWRPQCAKPKCSICESTEHTARTCSRRQETS